MVKTFSLFLLIASAAAFSSPMFGLRSSSVTLSMAPDRNWMERLDRDGSDAVRVVYQECDPEECTLATGVKTDDDHWEIRNGLEDDSKVVSRRVLMWEKEDTE